MANPFKVGDRIREKGLPVGCVDVVTRIISDTQVALALEDQDLAWDVDTMELDLPPEEDDEYDGLCTSCGGSGGGMHPMTCPSCNGSGLDPSARRRWEDN